MFGRRIAMAACLLAVLALAVAPAFGATVVRRSRTKE